MLSASTGRVRLEIGKGGAAIRGWGFTLKMSKGKREPIRGVEGGRPRVSIERSRIRTGIKKREKDSPLPVGTESG